MSGSPGEFEWEPVPGLPEVLPEGEIILWQGSPNHRSLARHAFHVPALALYFSALLVARIALATLDGAGLLEAIASSAGLLVIAVGCLALVELIAWLNARATVYTLTNRRVVMRIGVAIVVALNLPYREIASASLRSYSDGTGDIPIGLEDSAQLGFALLWPNARPWHFGDRAQPMLRSVPDAEAVAAILSTALASTLRPSDLPLAEQRSEAATIDGRVADSPGANVAAAAG